MSDTNTNIGINSLASILTGTNNSAIGYNSLNQLQDGSFNTAVGSNTLSTLLTGNNNIALGYHASKNNTNYNNTICIGAETYATEDNQVILGNEKTTTYMNSLFIKNLSNLPLDISDNINIGVVSSVSGFLQNKLVYNNDIASNASISDIKLNTINSVGKVLNEATTATSSHNSNTIVLRDNTGHITAIDQPIGTMNRTIATTYFVNNTIETISSVNPLSDTIVIRDENGIIMSNVEGDIHGNLSGNVSGNLYGNVDGDMFGIVIGNIYGNVAGDLINGNVSGNIKGDINGNLYGNIIGNIIGNVSGNVIGNLNGNVYGNLYIGNYEGNIAGNILGNVSGNLYGNVNGNVYGKTYGALNGNIYGNFVGDVTGNLFGNPSHVLGDVTGNLFGYVTNAIETKFAINANNAEVVSNVNFTSEAETATYSNTQAYSTNNKRIATTEFVQYAINNLDLSELSYTQLEELEKLGSNLIIINDNETAGVLHNDVCGNVFSSLIVNNDISSNQITLEKLNNSTISLHETPNTLVLRDGSGNIQNNIISNVTGNLFGNVTGDIVETTNIINNSILNIGGDSQNILIGSTNSIVNILGNLNYIEVTDLKVEGKLITINTGGAIDSAYNAGVLIQDGTDVSAGYIVTSENRENFIVKAPAGQEGTMVLQDNSTNTVTINNMIVNNVYGNLFGKVFGDITGNLSGTVIGDLNGDVNGNLLGNVTGNLTGSITGNLMGDIFGNVSGNLTGYVGGTVIQDFIGPFQSNNWTITTQNDGIVDISNMPESITMVTGKALYGNTSITMKYVGLTSTIVKFSWSTLVSINEPWGLYRFPFGYKINNTSYKLNYTKNRFASGIATLQLNPNDTFTFYNNSDGFGYPEAHTYDSTAVINNFSYTTMGTLIGTVNGNMNGNIIGNLSGNLIGDVTGNMVGNITGSITGNVVGDISGMIVGQTTTQSIIDVSSNNISTSSYVIDSVMTNYTPKLSLCNNSLNISTFANNWVPFTFTYATNFTNVALSSSGKIQIASEQNPNVGVYVSNDYGATWVKRTGHAFTYGIAISGTGQYQAATRANLPLLISNDYGNTWYQRGPTATWNRIAISSSGQYMLGTGDYNGQVYVSRDYGETWETKLFAGEWYLPLLSFSGQYQQVQNRIGAVFSYYFSNDYGNTWKQTTISSNLLAAPYKSSSGQYVISITSGQLYLSSDYGITRTAVGPNLGFSSASISSTGEYITAIKSGQAANSPAIYTCRNPSYVNNSNKLIGDVTGNLTGTSFGNLTGDVTGNLYGNVIGNITGNLRGNVYGNLYDSTTIVGNLVGLVTGNLYGNNINNTVLYTSSTTISSGSAKKIKFLIIGGGGGGGRNMPNAENIVCSGGGGSGAVCTLIAHFTSPTNITLNVGEGGAGAISTGFQRNGYNGGNSSVTFRNVTATAGGGGGGAGGINGGGGGGGGIISGIYLSGLNGIPGNIGYPTGVGYNHPMSKNYGKGGNGDRGNGVQGAILVTYYY